MSTLLIILWILASLIIIGLGLIHEIAPALPQFVTDLFLYGKAKGKQKEKTFVQWIEVPKRWFIHFYVVGTIVNSYMSYIVARAYLLGQPPPAIIIGIINYLNPQRTVTINGMTALLLIAMIFVQNARRLYECIYVSVYSKSTMNVLHYLLGFSLYGTFWMAVLSEAPNLNAYRVQNIDDEFIRWQNHVAIALFTWASYHHHTSHKILANLRKDQDGKVTSQRHIIPGGGWFEYISCPHYFFEIVIYCVFQLVAGVAHCTVWGVTFFVVSNQLVAAHVTHAWYRKQFKQYPRERKAVIPWVF